jgi:hypothetical protein
MLLRVGLDSSNLGQSTILRRKMTNKVTSYAGILNNQFLSSSDTRAMMMGHYESNRD